MLYNDKLIRFDAYYVTLINGWTGNCTIFINKQNPITVIVGLINGSNATDNKFAYGGATPNYQTIIDQKLLPIGHQAASIFTNQAITDNKIDFYYNASTGVWTGAANKDLGNIALASVYARSM